MARKEDIVVRLDAQASLQMQIKCVDYEDPFS